MFGPEFFDAFLVPGYAPNTHAVTVTSPDGSVSALPLTARREPTDEDVYQAVAAQYGAEVVTFSLSVGQSGYVRLRHGWVITDSGGDGTKWIVVRDDLTIADRELVVVCVRYNK